MDKSEDLELEETSKLESKPGEDEDFEELLVELGGFGKCLLTPFLFMAIPLLQDHQVRELVFEDALNRRATYSHRIVCFVDKKNPDNGNFQRKKSTF